jgi:hypothetical protein
MGVHLYLMGGHLMGGHLMGRASYGHTYLGAGIL